MDNEEKPSASKPLIAIGILVGITILSAVIPAKWFGINPVVYKNQPLDLSAITSASEIAKDTNNDGSISWNEIINQTFPESTSAESIKGAPVDEKVIEQLNDPNNLTSSFSKNLYVASAYINKNGGIDADSQQAVLDQLISQEASKIIPTTYTYKDIKIAPKEDKISIKTYGNSVAIILQEVITKKIMTDDFSSMNSFTQTKNESDLLPLVKNRDRVGGLIQKLLSISVPPSAISYHILALNRIALYKDTLDDISKANTDPVRAKLAIEKYTEMMVLVLRIPNQFSNYFDVQNIVFSSKEAGYMFTAGYTIN